LTWPLYREVHPPGPFAMLIAVAASYRSPDAYDGHRKISSARLGRRRPTTMRCAPSRPRFGERWLIQASCQATSSRRRLNSTTEATRSLVRRLWRDLYRDESISGS
jgi:hypothetical protein